MTNNDRSPRAIRSTRACWPFLGVFRVPGSTNPVALVICVIPSPTHTFQSGFTGFLSPAAVFPFADAAKVRKPYFSTSNREVAVTNASMRGQYAIGPGSRKSCPNVTEKLTVFPSNTVHSPSMLCTHMPSYGLPMNGPTAKFALGEVNCISCSFCNVWYDAPFASFVLPPTTLTLNTAIDLENSTTTLVRASPTESFTPKSPSASCNTGEPRSDSRIKSLTPYSRLVGWYTRSTPAKLATTILCDPSSASSALPTANNPRSNSSPVPQLVLHHSRALNRDMRRAFQRRPPVTPRTSSGQQPRVS
mmetsp:Transcript_13766/g.51536  ORF Transcript_13766/g.51536 Transcript_13766/m.51536 type:complete len:304 (-) Transcript_13766:132-1043(-)